MPNHNRRNSRIRFSYASYTKNCSLDEILRKSITKTELLKHVDDMPKKFNLGSLNLREISYLQSLGYISDSIFEKKMKNSYISEVVALFISDPSKKLYDILESKMTKADFYYMLYEYPNIMEKYVDFSKFNGAAMFEYIAGCEKLGMKKKSARRFLDAIDEYTNKTEVRMMIDYTFRYMTTEDVRRLSAITMKEFLSLFEKKHRAGKKSAIVFDKDFLEFIEKKLFIETLSGKSTISSYQNKNLELIRSLVKEHGGVFS